MVLLSSHTYLTEAIGVVSSSAWTAVAAITRPAMARALQGHETWAGSVSAFVQGTG